MEEGLIEDLVDALENLLPASTGGRAGLIDHQVYGEDVEQARKLIIRAKEFLDGE